MNIVRITKKFRLSKLKELRRNVSTEHIIERNIYQDCFRSIIPTNHFQRGLPKLPIPELEKIKPLFLEHFSFFSSQKDFDGLLNSYNASEPNILRLNDILIEKSKNLKSKSWLSEYWLNYQYLNCRKPILLYSNPTLAFKCNIYENNTELLAAKLIVNSLRLYRSYKNQLIVPDIINFDYDSIKNSKLAFLASKLPSKLAYYLIYSQKMYPLDMSQYNRMFGTTRIPKPERDELITYENSRHIVVIIEGNMFKVNVLDEDGYILSIKTIQNTLNKLVNLSREYTSMPVGIFTTDERSRWASIRKLMEQIPSYKSNLNTLDSALFVVCLDQVEKKYDTNRDIATEFLYEKLHNRWLDKSFQIIVNSNGNSGVNFEHSWGDGYPIMLLLEKVSQMCDVDKNIPQSSGICDFEPLKWEDNSTLLKELEISKHNATHLINKLRFNSLKINGFGRKSLKSFKPDAIMQLAFQIAYFKVFQQIPNVYEAAATIGFSYGRTETLRPVTSKSIDALKFYHTNMDNLFNEKNSLKFVQMVKEQGVLHGKNHMNCLTGFSFDRYLFVLQCLSEQENIPVEFFNNPIYKRVIKDFDLSTSTLNSKYIKTWGYGPPTETCIGLGYVLRQEYAELFVSYFNQPDEAATKYQKLISAIDETFEMLMKVLKTKSIVK